MKRPLLLLAAALTFAVAAPSFAYDNYLTIDDVVRMSREGVSASVIIAQIESTRSAFSLSTRDILELTDDGVPQSVIEAMIRTADEERDGRNDSYDRSGDYSTRYDDGYRYHDDIRYRFSFALALGYYDPWNYYYPWGAYYAACYPFYRVHYAWYYPFYYYDPWYYGGRHYWYPSYPYDRVNVDTGGRHLWGRAGGSSSGSSKPYYRTDARSHYGRKPGVLPRTTRKPPAVETPPRQKKPPVISRSPWHRPGSDRTVYRKPATPPPDRSRGSGGTQADASRRYGARPPGVDRSR